MSFSLAIVGLPQSGKTTLFRALTGGKVEIPVQKGGMETHIGSVGVPDPRLDALEKFFTAAKKVPVYITFVDLAPLSGEPQKEMGGQLLNQIKECDGLLIVLRGFTQMGLPPGDPRSEAESLNLEMMLADLKIIEQSYEKREKLVRMGQKQYAQEVELLGRLKEALSKDTALRKLDLTAQEKFMLKAYSFLTLKPVIYILNLDESQKPDCLEIDGHPVIPVYAKLEAELAEMPPEEAEYFAKELGVQTGCLRQVIAESYKALGLLTFLTGSETEVRAWAVPCGSSASECAGYIHSDLQKGFIKAEVIQVEKLLELGSMHKAKETGLLRLEGRDYPVKEGEICHIRFH